jgi:hypothetical protein
MSPRIYDKTDKGREEIATRKNQLQSKLRTLLVMIDGRHSLESLQKNFAVLGLSAENVDELLRQQYISLVSGGPEASEAEPQREAPRPPASARARMQARQAARQANAAEAGHADGAAVESTADEAAADTAAVSPDQAERFRALYDFYNQTIKSTIGLRGIGLQLRVEKAASIAEFQALRLPYLQAVLKAKGRAMALALRERLDELLGGKPEVDDFALPDETSAASRGPFDYFNLANDSVNF